MLKKSRKRWKQHSSSPPNTLKNWLLSVVIWRCQMALYIWQLKMVVFEMCLKGKWENQKRITQFWIAACRMVDCPTWLLAGIDSPWHSWESRHLRVFFKNDSEENEGKTRIEFYTNWKNYYSVLVCCLLSLSKHDCKRRSPSLLQNSYEESDIQKGFIFFKSLGLT